MVIGVVGLAVVVVLIVMLSRGGSSADANSKPAPQPAAQAASAAPAAAPVQLADARAGKKPARPAPALTQQMLDDLRATTKAAGVLYNEGVTARTAGDNTIARDKQAKARDTLERLDTVLKDALLWQEEAQMEGWEQPAEYVTLEREYGAAMNLTKKIRMGGGK